MKENTCNQAASCWKFCIWLVERKWCMLKVFLLTASCRSHAIFIKLWAKPFSSLALKARSSKSWRKWNAILSNTMSFTWNKKKKTKQNNKELYNVKKKKKKKLCKEGGNYTTLMNSHKLWQILYTLKGSFFRPHQYPLLTLATFKSIPPLGGGGKGGSREEE